VADDQAQPKPIWEIPVGIVGYPTQILIDRRGNVVGQFILDEQGLMLLEKTLAEK
jgi:hypothetical protein